MKFIDRLNMVLLWVVIALGFLVIWESQARANITQPLRSQLELGYQYQNGEMSQVDRWLYCGCVVQKLDLLYRYWDTYPEALKIELLIVTVYIPCTANKRRKA